MSFLFFIGQNKIVLVFNINKKYQRSIMSHYLISISTTVSIFPLIECVQFTHNLHFSSKKCCCLMKNTNFTGRKHREFLVGDESQWKITLILSSEIVMENCNPEIFCSFRILISGYGPDNNHFVLKCHQKGYSNSLFTFTFSPFVFKCLAFCFT